MSLAKVLICTRHPERCLERMRQLEDLGYRVVFQRDQERKPRLQNVEAVFVNGEEAWAEWMRKWHVQRTGMAVRYFYN